MRESKGRGILTDPWGANPRAKRVCVCVENMCHFLSPQTHYLLASLLAIRSDDDDDDADCKWKETFLNAATEGALAKGTLTCSQ